MIDLFNIPSSADGSPIPALMVAQRLIANHPDFAIQLMDKECQSNVEFSNTYAEVLAEIDDELRIIDCAANYAMVEMYRHEDFNADFMLDV
jgi:hypothetical protein